MKQKRNNRNGTEINSKEKSGSIEDGRKKEKWSIKKKKTMRKLKINFKKKEKKDE